MKVNCKDSHINHEIEKDRKEGFTRKAALARIVVAKSHGMTYDIG